MRTVEHGGLTVLLAVGEQRDRELLRRWLDDVDGLEPLVADPTDGDPFADAFDVCLLDVKGARTYGEALAARRAETVTYLPTLLLVAERYGSPEEVLAELGETADCVDDTVAAPVRKAGIARRLRSLGRAREYSTQLAASRNRFRRLVELLPDAVFLLSDGEVTYANGTAGELLGVDADEVVGRRFSSFAAPDERDRVACVLEAAATDGQGGPVETGLVRRRTHDADGGATPQTGPWSEPTADTWTERDRGEWVPVELSAVDAGDGEIQVLVRDRSEYNEREKRLALYRRAMDEATVGITIADHTAPDEPLMYVNEEFQRLTGRSEDELLGENPRLLQTDATDPETVARLRAAIDAGEETAVEILNRRSDGRTWYNALDISPVTDESGEVTHYVGFQRDVTDRVTREQRVAVLDRVLRHNIRNRLNVVLGFAEDVASAVAAETDGTDGNAAIDPDRITSDVERITNAARDLLELAESARHFREEVLAPGSSCPGDATELLVAVCAQVATVEPDAEVRVSLPDADERERDRLRVTNAPGFRLVAEELLSNAVEHPEVATVTASLSREGDTVVLRVDDDGPGVPHDDRAALEGTVESPTEHGQGVGLWLVRWTVDAVGGSIAYEDTGDGARFTVRFPAADAETETDANPETDTVADTNPERDADSESESESE